MRHIINKLIKKTINSFGYSLEMSDPIMKKDLIFQDIYSKCEKHTMTTKGAMYELYKAVQYVIKSKINGDFVECGVWKGGSVMLIALTLIELKETNRDIYLYDTFEGMSEPTEADRPLSNESVDAKTIMNKRKIVKAISPLDEVKRNISSTNYPIERIHFVKGKVEDTIPGIIPREIALLRLDTDWYESSMHELIYLYPILIKNGVLILDDYGYWAGQKKATDEYFDKKNMLLIGINSGGVIIGIKTE